jgi:hypothetical protein
MVDGQRLHNNARLHPGHRSTGTSHTGRSHPTGSGPAGGPPSGAAHRTSYFHLPYTLRCPSDRLLPQRALMRLDVLDIGSNTVHLLVVDAHRVRTPTRCGRRRASCGSPSISTGVE